MVSILSIGYRSAKLLENHDLVVDILEDVVTTNLGSFSIDDFPPSALHSYLKSHYDSLDKTIVNYFGYKDPDFKRSYDNTNLFYLSQNSFCTVLSTSCNSPSLKDLTSSLDVCHLGSPLHVGEYARYIYEKLRTHSYEL